ncbi:carbon catabolite repressor protein 4 homolog 5 isoform X2 [Cicer arietinum]|uniref:carbon catabolite repressor protein 4 homolog 5 isoform X2 n=1 Tax=Cicer arietinum TaxID=3827 RepID=UPI003CC58489
MVRRKRENLPPENSNRSYPSKRRRHSTGSESLVSSSRKWVFSSEDCSDCTDTIVVVSYNILGVENASNHLDLYSNIPRRFLEWGRRKRLILEEIDSYNANILCFQEVDHFDDLDDLFKNNGFKSVYKGRTGEANDGCAIFWKDKLFSLLHQEDIEFQKFGLRNNVAQLCVLEVNHDNPESDTSKLTTEEQSTRKKRFLIGNTHVLFNPNRGDIKLGQIRLLIDQAYKLSQEWGNIPVILAGDLNSVPQSAIYEFLSSSKLDIRLHDRRNMSGQLEIRPNDRVFRSKIGDDASISMSVSRQLLHKWSAEELILATGAKGVTRLKHQLKLRSAYSGVPMKSLSLETTWNFFNGRLRQW